MIRNTLFDTWPCLIHGHGPHSFKPQWEAVRDGFAEAQVQPTHLPPANLTVVTCNNGHQAMGMFERSCQRWEQPFTVCGQGRVPWVNSKDKPEALFDVLGQLTTDYVLYADSRDAIMVGDLQYALDTFLREFPGCKLLMGADRLNWPNVPEFSSYEKSLPGAENEGGFAFLNGGVWLGEREFAREFFAEALRTEPVATVADSEQGILKKLFPRYYPRVQLDYQSRIIANLGFVFTTIMAFEPRPSEQLSSTPSGS